MFKKPTKEEPRYLFLSPHYGEESEKFTGKQLCRRLEEKIRSEYDLMKRAEHAERKNRSYEDKISNLNDQIDTLARRASDLAQEVINNKKYFIRPCLADGYDGQESRVIYKVFEKYEHRNKSGQIEANRIGTFFKKEEAEQAIKELEE